MSKFMEWLDARFPATKMWEDHLSKYYAPKNFNFYYFFGSLALLVLVNQLLTGIWLTMSYEPSAEGAFASVEYIMRDVHWGWLIRYLHSTGASAFFIVVYLHMFRALLYGSYRKPRELLWLVGMVIYAVLMAEAFFGYLLPWGQMSYWGAQVITSLFGAIPYVGVSKPSCTLCSTYFECYRGATISTISTRETHSRLVPWQAPSLSVTDPLEEALIADFRKGLCGYFMEKLQYLAQVARARRSSLRSTGAHKFHQSMFIAYHH